MDNLKCYKHGHELPCQDCSFFKIISECKAKGDDCNWQEYWTNQWRTEQILKGLKEDIAWGLEK